jgi:DNA-binding CsgD family transcriptional regulator
MEDYGTARQQLEDSIALARAEGLASDLPHALSVLAELDFRHGRWSTARQLADEAIRLATDIGQDFHWARVQLAQLDAVTGDTGGVREHVDVIVEFARQSGSRSLDVYASAALGLLELGYDDPAAAADHLERTQTLVEAIGLAEPNVVQWRADLVESQCRTGRADDAARTLATFQREADETGRRWALAAAARCRALLAPAADIDRLFGEAHRLAAAGPSAFELARTELCWGERLRREHRRVEARRHLNHALERFRALGAVPWAQKAARELGSSGARARRGARAPTAMTPAESQIAALVAEGMTNKDIAASLFLSPKTIEFHLGRIYRKLDIHSRTQLARAVLLSGLDTP